MRNVWGIKAIFMAFWSAFSHKKEWGHLLEGILYTSRYSITQELQLLDEFSFCYLFLLFFDRHPQLVCEHVKELNYMCHTQKACMPYSTRSESYDQPRFSANEKRITFLVKPLQNPRSSHDISTIFSR